MVGLNECGHRTYRLFEIDQKGAMRSSEIACSLMFILFVQVAFQLKLHIVVGESLRYWYPASSYTANNRVTKHSREVGTG